MLNAPTPASSAAGPDGETRGALREGAPMNAMGGAWFLPRNGLQALIDLLHADGRKVIGPTIAGDAIVCEEITGADDLPRGVGDEQALAVLCRHRARQQQGEQQRERGPWEPSHWSLHAPVFGSPVVNRLPATGLNSSWPSGIGWVIQ